MFGLWNVCCAGSGKTGMWCPNMAYCAITRTADGKKVALEPADNARTSYVSKALQLGKTIVVRSNGEFDMPDMDALREMTLLQEVIDLNTFRMYPRVLQLFKSMEYLGWPALLPGTGKCPAVTGEGACTCAATLDTG